MVKMLPKLPNFLRGSEALRIRVGIRQSTEVGRACRRGALQLYCPHERLP